MGDVNIDLLKNESEELKNLVTSNNYSILNAVNPSCFTRRDSVSLSIIDHCYTDIPNKFLLQLGESALSDHRFMFVVLNRSGKHLDFPVVTKKYVNFKNITNKLHERYESSSFESFEELHNFLKLSIANETTYTNINNKTNHKKPWANSELKELCKQKRKYYKLRRNFPENLYFQNKFRETKQLVQIEVNRLKKEYYSNLYKNNLNNAKEAWKITKEIIYNTKTINNQKTIKLKNENRLITNPVEVANEINEFFTSVGKLQEQQMNPSVFEFESRPFLNTKLSTFTQTNSREVGEIIKLLDNNKALGDDEIPTKFLKKNVEIFSNLLSNFINVSFELGTFPDSLKFARVIPLYKNEDPRDVGNYRPISILPVISKIFERVIKTRLIKHLETNKLIHPNQYGFLKNSNTTTAASCLVNDIVSGMNEKQKTACIYVDVTKAFDCLNFEILTEKLHAMGVEDKALSVLQNYMNNRKQVVVVDGKRSTEIKITSGAAQRSVLGPLLFLIYINDLLYLKLNSVGRLFADDAAFVY